MASNRTLYLWSVIGNRSGPNHNRPPIQSPTYPARPHLPPDEGLPNAGHFEFLTGTPEVESQAGATFLPDELLTER